MAYPATLRYTKAVSPKLTASLKQYEAFHRTPGNQLTHFVGIPMIFISIFGILSQFLVGRSEFFGSPLFRLDGGSIALGFVIVWYLLLDLRVGFSFSFFALGAYFIGRTIPLGVLIAFFVVGWIIQYIGHGVYEKKSPAFYTNLKHLLIGPLWVFLKVLRSHH